MAEERKVGREERPSIQGYYAEKYWPGEYPRTPVFLIGEGGDFNTLEELVQTVNSYVEDETRDGTVVIRTHHFPSLRELFTLLISGIENIPTPKPFLRWKDYLMVQKPFISNHITQALAERIREGMVRHMKFVVNEPDIYCRLCPTNTPRCFPSSETLDDWYVRRYGLEVGKCYPISEVFEILINNPP